MKYHLNGSHLIKMLITLNMFKFKFEPQAGLRLYSLLSNTVIFPFLVTFKI